MLFHFKDSLNLLLSSLNSLAKNLFPGLGNKGSLDHNSINLWNLAEKREEVIEYMKQDIILLGGVMQKAQNFVGMSTSLFCIHIPNRNEDTFIHRGYYSGHTDAYIPRGESQFYYDVNALYSYVIKEYPMLGGKPVRHSDLSGMDLDSMCGFVEAYVECPDSMERPFLSYRGKDNILLFPTGQCVSVYYSEELKYAREQGYTLHPIMGYLFQKMEIPFQAYVNTLYESRS
ncbi:DNA polymerase [Bienertia sinuspersici]